ncbi:unnamed protein product [Arctogadus glacialis]
MYVIEQRLYTTLDTPRPSQPRHTEPPSCVGRVGGWNNNPTAGQFQGIFRKLMCRCGVKPVDSGNMRGQDATITMSADYYTRVSLSAAEMSSADAATAEELVSP